MRDLQTEEGQMRQTSPLFELHQSGITMCVSSAWPCASTAQSWRKSREREGGRAVEETKETGRGGGRAQWAGGSGGSKAITRERPFLPEQRYRAGDRLRVEICPRQSRGNG